MTGPFGSRVDREGCNCMHVFRGGTVDEEWREEYQAVMAAAVTKKCQPGRVGDTFRATTCDSGDRESTAPIDHVALPFAQPWNWCLRSAAHSVTGGSWR